MAYEAGSSSSEDMMALSPQNQSGPSIEESFVADRAMFWNRFTGFTKWAVIALVVLLLGMWLFLV